MVGDKPVSGLLAKTVFTLTCRSCGTPVEIPGRFGFKLKGSGINSTLCNRCRQLQFREARANDLASVDANDPDSRLGQSTARRLLPTAAAFSRRCSRGYPIAFEIERLTREGKFNTLFFKLAHDA